MKKQALNKDDWKELSATALLDIVSALVPGSIGLTLPIIGNVICSASGKKAYNHEMREIKQRIECLELTLQEEIKEELIRVGELVSEKYSKVENNHLPGEVYSVDAVEVIFRTELDFEMIENVQQSLNYYIKGGVDYDEFILDNSDTNCPVDIVYTTQNGAVFNLFDSVTRGEVQELLEDVDRIIQLEDGGNQIKRVILY